MMRIKILTVFVILISISILYGIYLNINLPIIVIVDSTNLIISFNLSQSYTGSKGIQKIHHDLGGLDY